MLTELKCIILLLLHSVFCKFLSKHQKLLILIFTYKVAYLRSFLCVSVATLVTIIIIHLFFLHYTAVYIYTAVPIGVVIIILIVVLVTLVACVVWQKNFNSKSSVQALAYM